MWVPGASLIYYEIRAAERFYEGVPGEDAPCGTFPQEKAHIPEL
jgi:hypothetical protein